jgi:hypothetical protein
MSGGDKLSWCIRKGHTPEGKLASELVSKRGKLCGPLQRLDKPKKARQRKKCYCIKSRQKKGKYILSIIYAPRHKTLSFFFKVCDTICGEAALGNYGPGGRNFIKHFLKANKYVTRYLVIWI